MYCYRRESSSSVTLAGLASGTGRAACARYVYRVVVLVPVRDEQTTAQRAAQGLFVPVHINEAWTWLCPHDPSIHPHRPDGATGWSNGAPHETTRGRRPLRTGLFYRLQAPPPQYYTSIPLRRGGQIVDQRCLLPLHAVVCSVVGV
jgi:hypothetical protein